MPYEFKIQDHSDNHGFKDTQSPYEGPKAKNPYPGDTGPSKSRWGRIEAAVMALKIHNLHTKVRKRKFLIEETPGLQKRSETNGLFSDLKSEKNQKTPFIFFENREK